MTKIEIIHATREILSCDIEENVSYKRTDNKQIEMSAAFLDLQDPLLMFAEYEQDDEPGYPSGSMHFSMEEARLLRDLLNRPAVAAILDETDEDKARRPAGFSKSYLDQLAEQIQQG